MLNFIVYFCFALVLIIGTYSLIQLIIKVKQHPDFLLNELPEIFFNGFSVVVAIVLLILFLIYG